jgi:CRP-like cAMP-binding protein
MESAEFTMSKRVQAVRPPPAGRTRPKNKLLACLPADDFARVQRELKTVPIKVKQILHRLSEPLKEVYFLNGGVASITAVMKNGAMVEVANVGDEGVVGIGALFTGRAMNSETMIQVPDTSAEVMSVEAFKREIKRNGPFQESIERYSEGLLALMTQSTGCVALHPVYERCCRWLLMTHDRVGHDQFKLSHEFLAMMIGATRPTVSSVAGEMQKAGLIKYTHGQMTIVDRSRLEQTACECYATVKEQFDRLGL